MITVNKRTLTCALVMATLVVAGVAVGADEAKGWDTSLAVGGNLTRGNSDTMGVNAALTTRRDYEKTEYRFGLEANYGENTTTAADGSDDTLKTTENAKLYANVKRKLGAPYVYSDTSIFHDELADLDYRLIVSIGGGAYLLDDARDKLGLEAGLAYVVEAFKSGANSDGLALRLAARHDHTFSATAKMWTAVEYLPQIEDFGDYLLSAEIGTETVLNSSLNLRLVVQDRYDSTPSAGLDENDLSVIAALVFKP